MPPPAEITVEQVRLAIALEEEASSQRSSNPVPETSRSAFIIAGLAIEKAQCVFLSILSNGTLTALHRLSIKLELSNRKQVNTLTEASRCEQRNNLRRQIQKFRRAQDEHMPTLRQHVATGDSGTPLPPVHEESLLLPSHLAEEIRRAVCDDDLVDIEHRLRYAQCHEALNNLRDHLRARMIVSIFKVKNSVGQKENTRSRQTLSSIDAKIIAAKHEYRQARAALLTFRGPGNWEHELRELNDDDVRAINERALTTQERAERAEARRLAGIEGDEVEGIMMDGVVQTGEGFRTLSWIWLSESGRARGSLPREPGVDEATALNTFQEVDAEGMSCFQQPVYVSHYRSRRLSLQLFVSNG